MAGVRTDSPLHAHTCKHGIWNQDGRFDVAALGNGVIRMPHYELCLQARTLRSGLGSAWRNAPRQSSRPGRCKTQAKSRWKPLLRCPAPEPPAALQIGNATEYQSILEFESPAQAYPGRTIRVAGTLSVLDGPEPSSVRLAVFLGAEVIGSLTGSSPFEGRFLIPPTALLGRQLLTLMMPSHGRYEEAATSAYVNVLKANPVVRVDSLVFELLPRDLAVAGEVTSVFGPLENARVTPNPPKDGLGDSP